MMRARRAVTIGALAVLALSCKSPEEISGTFPFAVTGVAYVSGRLVSTTGLPLDRFRVNGSVVEGQDPYAMYSVGVFFEPKADGTYLLRFERSAGGPPLTADSVRVGLGVQSWKFGKIDPDMPDVLDVRYVWVRFAKPPVAPDTVILNLTVP